jgi:hypothetical protein
LISLLNFVSFVIDDPLHSFYSCEWSRPSTPPSPTAIDLGASACSTGLWPDFVLFCADDFPGTSEESITVFVARQMLPA